MAMLAALLLLPVALAAKLAPATSSLDSSATEGDDLKADGRADAAAPWPMYGRGPTHGRELPAAPVLSANASRWVHRTGGWVYGAPCVDADETIYFGSWDGYLYAVHPDGNLKWRLMVGANTGLEEQLWSSCALAAAAGDSSALSNQTGPTVYIGANESLVAVGQTAAGPVVRWALRTGAAVFASPTVDADGVIYIGGLDSKMRAVRPDGSVLWTHQAVAPIYASAAVSHDAVFFSTLLDGRVVAVARADGTLRWSKAASLEPIPSSPSLSPDGRTLYVASTDGHLRALSTRDGQVRWATKVGLVDGSSPAVAADGTAVFIGTVEPPALHAVASAGAPLWQVPADDMVQSSPCIGRNGTIFFSSFKSTLFAVERSGRVLWTTRMRGSSFSSPALGSRGLYVGVNGVLSGPKGGVYAFLGE
jgi:outer membrane protein assembly factor BamB